MPKKSTNRPIVKTVDKSKIQAPKSVETNPLGNRARAYFSALSPYFHGILLFFGALIIGLFTYKDYGVSWDETIQHAAGESTYNYIFFGNENMFQTLTINYGVGFELVLTFIEKWANMTDPRDIYLMRHFVTHLLFLVSVFSGYVLLLRLFKDKFIASLGFMMLLLAPRLYAHSFFNSKDIPFMSMFLITLTGFQIAFEKNKLSRFFVLGLLCGYTTSIRVMGIMLCVFILFFLMIDLATGSKDKASIRYAVFKTVAFCGGFSLMLYAAWPYLWHDPVRNFVKSYTELAHFDLFKGYNLIGGNYVAASKIPWYYFPVWFLISNPELWLLAGIAGFILLAVNFFKGPAKYLKNTTERNFLLYAMCFFSPVLAVIILHSVIYDDWRHLYFVYPPFIFMAIYCINSFMRTRYQVIVKSLCLLQVLLVGFFMVKNFPFGQVYFNNLVAHDKEYLRRNYDMDYWGCSYKQALEHLLEENKSQNLLVSCDYGNLVENNQMILAEDDRKRIHYTDAGNADYLITNYRGHPYDYPSYESVFSINVLNSTILNIFKVEKDTAKQRAFNNEEISILRKVLADRPDDYNAHAGIATAFADNKKFDSAEGYVKWVCLHNPENIGAVKELGIISFYENKFDQAIVQFKIVAGTEAPNAKNYANIANCFLKLAKYDSCINYSNIARSIDPNFSRPYEYLAISYRVTGSLDSAKKYEAIAQKYNPAFRLL